MAGDWIKVELCTPEKSEVLAITATMGWDDPDLTVGKLFRLWRWFDQQTVNGNAASVTFALLDRIIGVTGFCEAVQKVGWLAVNADGISLPGFEKHNGNTAKSRALTARRVAKFKENFPGNGEGNEKVTPPPLPREEKRREEKIKTLEAVARDFETEVEEIKKLHLQTCGLSSVPPLKIVREILAAGNPVSVIEDVYQLCGGDVHMYRQRNIIQRLTAIRDKPPPEVKDTSGPYVPKDENEAKLIETMKRRGFWDE